MPRKQDPRIAAQHALAAAKYQLKNSAYCLGEERTLRQLEIVAGKPAFPLPPWSEHKWYQSKGGKA